MENFKKTNYNFSDNYKYHDEDIYLDNEFNIFLFLAHLVDRNSLQSNKKYDTTEYDFFKIQKKVRCFYKKNIWIVLLLCMILTYKKLEFKFCLKDLFHKYKLKQDEEQQNEENKDICDCDTMAMNDNLSTKSFDIHPGIFKM